MGATRSSYRGSWLWGFRRYDKFSALASQTVTEDDVASLGVEGAAGYTGPRVVAVASDPGGARGAGNGSEDVEDTPGQEDAGNGGGGGGGGVLVLVGWCQRAAVFEPRYGDEVRRRLRLPAARARQMRERFEGIRALFEVCA